MSQSSGMSQKRVSPGAVPGVVGVRPRPAARTQPTRQSAKSRLGAGPGGPTQRAAGGGVGPLTGLGVTILLLTACLLGALLDLFLVDGPAWAVVSLYIVACGYTASRVRGADWYAALVAPPIAFALAMILLAKLMPESFGPGLLGLAATTFELLAAKAKALYFGVTLSAVILMARRLRRQRN
jgi:hypothetical protein